MRYMVRTSYVNVLGYIWLPHALCSTRIKLSGYDIENMRDDEGVITRDSVDQWLAMNAGDFSQIVDFEASIEDGDETIDLPFASEENECAYLDTISEEN